MKSEFLTFLERQSQNVDEGKTENKDILAIVETYQNLTQLSTESSGAPNAEQLSRVEKLMEKLMKQMEVIQKLVLTKEQEKNLN